MTISYRAATTTESTGTAAIVNNVPTGTVNGDVLVWLVSNAGTATVPATPAGWTLVISGTTTQASSVIWWRVAASEPANYTTGALTSSRGTGIMSAYAGVDTTTPFDVTTPAMVAGTTAVACPAITPVTAGAWVVGTASASVGSGVINTTYSSGNLTAIDTQVTSTQGASGNNVEATGHFLWASGAFTPTYTTSNASTRTLGATLALRPAVFTPELVMAPRTY